MTDDPMMDRIAAAAVRDGERRAPQVALDQVVAEVAGRAEARRTLRRTRRRVLGGLLALAVMIAWLVGQGARSGDTAVVLPFVAVAVVLVVWWFVQDGDRKRYGHLLVLPTVPAVAEEVVRRSAALAACGREFGDLARRLAATRAALGAQEAGVGRLGAADVALVRAVKDAAELDARVTTLCLAVAHFAESCEGAPGRSALEYGRLPVALDRPRLRQLVDRLLGEIDQAHARLLGVAFAADDDGGRAVDATRELQSVRDRLRACAAQVRADGYRLARAVDRLHLLATGTVLDDIADGGPRRATSQLILRVAVRGRPVEHRPASRTAFVDAATDSAHPPGGWRALAHGGVAAVAHTHRAGTGGGLR